MGEKLWPVPTAEEVGICERRAEFDAACKAYGEAVEARIRAVFLSDGGVDFEATNATTQGAWRRVQEAWRAMVGNRDPGTR